jgi:putative thioredoxin
MDVTEATWQRDVIERSRERPVVVDFWADWCGPCRTLTPVLEREAEERKDEIDVAKVDVDANPHLAAEYQVRGIPAVKAFRDGRVVDEFVGVRSPQGVADFLDALTRPSAAEQLLDELRTEGRWPEVVDAIESGDDERALERLLAELDGADPDTRDRIRRVMVALFDRLGQDDPVASRYRRRLATALY